MTNEARFAQLALEGRSMVRRMLDDWPYQPPEVVGPEREAFKRWVEESDFSGAHLLVLASQGQS
jgi:hypothetical protein